MDISRSRYLNVRYTRLVVRVVMLVAVLLAGITLSSILEQWRTRGEMGALLSAFFSDQVLHDVRDRGTGRDIQIVLLREAQSPWERGRLRQSLLLDRRSSFSQSSKISRASFFLSNALSTDIQADLHLPSGVQSFFISRTELEGTKPLDFQTRFPNNLGYFVVSHAGLNPSKTEAIMYVEHSCPGLCGGGGYFLMRKLDGVWRVVDQHVTWIS